MNRDNFDIKKFLTENRLTINTKRTIWDDPDRLQEEGEEVSPEKIPGFDKVVGKIIGALLDKPAPLQDIIKHAFFRCVQKQDDPEFSYAKDILKALMPSYSSSPEIDTQELTTNDKLLMDTYKAFTQAVRKVLAEKFNVEDHE